jgi:hypothetical protein
VTFTPTAARTWGFGPYDAPELLMNGVDDYGVEWVLGPVEGWDRTSASTPMIEGAGDGGRFAPGRRRPKPLTLRGAFRSCHGGADLYAAETRLRAALERWTTDQLIWHTGTVPKQMAVRLVGDLDVDTPRRNPRLRVWSAVLAAADPFKYAAGQGGLVTAGAGLPQLGTTGLVFPVQFPADFGGASLVTGRIAATNAGSQPVYPVTSITGPGTNLRLRHMGKDQSVGITRNLNSGEVIVFDHRIQSVSALGRSIYTQRIPGNVFFTLDPGANTLSFQADSYDVTSQVSISWRPRWS